MTGQDLHELILEKWGYSYDVQIAKFKGKLFVQVMWKYLEQQSFPLSEAEYVAHLDTIGHYIAGWGAVAQVRQAILETKTRPRVGKAVSIPIDLGDRSAEWLLEIP